MGKREFVFTDVHDKALLDGRGAGIGWTRLASSIGCRSDEAISRHKDIVGDRADTVRVMAKRGPDPDEDGLDRLVRKRRLTPARFAAADHYRRTCRAAMLDGGQLRSSLGAADAPRGSGTSFNPTPGPAFTATAARRELFLLRFSVLGGQPDMLTVMDGVCGAGHTLRNLGGSPVRAAELEAVLRVALDLIHTHLHPGEKKVA